MIDEKTINFCSKCNVQVTKKVADYSRQKYDGEVYCFNCQKEMKKTKKESSSPVKDSWEDDIINYETLLNEAHNKFKNFRIETELIDKDMEKQWAIVKARVTIIESEEMRYFDAHGDATQINCQSSMIKPHFLRMAETRAIARALRWATNNAKTAEEEK